MSHLYQHEVIIREHHLDTFGHVNNAVYLMLYEEARWEYITQAGYGLEKVHAEKIGPVAIDALVKYKKELVLREKITIETTFVGMQNSLCFKLHQEMKKADGRLASTLDITLAMMDFSKRKLIVPPTDWLQAMGQQ